MTMMTFTTDAPQQCGIVELDQNGLVASFSEKVSDPPGNLANAAVYILEPEVMTFMETLRQAPIEFSTDVIPHFVGRIFAFHNGAYHRDIGTLKSLMQAQLEYPLVAETEAAAAETDPWHGLMRDAGGRLARELSNALQTAFGPGGS
jgi:mannose-1-phosphate guanylyltransferase